MSTRSTSKTFDAAEAVVAAAKLAADPKRSKEQLRDALHLLRRAANEGHREAHYALGNWHFHGIAVRKNYKRGADFMATAAKLGRRKRFTTCRLLRTVGVGQDARRPWHCTASRSPRRADAQQMLPMLLLWHRPSEGRGRVSRWFKIAGQRPSEAQYAVARSYELGDGVRSNLRTALLWYQRAAKQGDDGAKKAALDVSRKLKASRTQAKRRPTR